jgi:hypothetical protein
MFQTAAQEIAIVLAGASLGWILLFSFVLSPASFDTFDQGRAERLVKNVMKSGHSWLASLCLLSGIASLLSGAVGAAVVAGVAACFAIGCQWALAPRTDRPVRGHRVLKTARIVASGLTACIMPVMIVAILLTRAGV